MNTNINFTYAGIGSRDCPEWVLTLMFSFAKYMGTRGYTLHSGGADGADLAFERGCDSSNGAKHIYLPWPGFNNSTSTLVVSNPTAWDIASQFHPAWDRLSTGARKLHARNCHQTLGTDLQSPVRFIVCYTPNGSGSGGTGQALRLAKFYNIPIFDMGNYNNISDCRVALKRFLDNIEG